MSRLELVVLVASLLLLAFIVEVVRRRRLSEGYALLWIAVGVGVLLLGVLRPLVDRLSRLVGVSYGANLVFAVAIVFLVVVCVNLSMHVSRLEEKVQTLAEEVALLHGPRAGAAPGATDAATPTAPVEPVDTTSSAGDDDPGL
jgi:hypothetical protein